MPSQIALFRLSVLGALTSRIDIQHGELKKLIKEQSKKQFDIPNSNKVQISSRTIERWYQQWRKYGLEGLEPKTRSDKGNCKLSAESKALVIKLKKEDMRRSLTTLLDLLSQQGYKNLPRSSVHRFLQQHNLSGRVVSDAPSIERRQFLAQHSNEIWYGDVMHGPKVMSEKGLKKVYLVTILDDASRLVAHAEFCLNEKAISIEKVLKEAVMRRGLPNRFIVDNGPAYKSHTLQEVCARLDIRLIYCRPYEP
jgi:transposase InsO family protein